MDSFVFEFDYYGRDAKTTIKFDEAWFKADSAIYNHKLACFCSQYASIGYTLPCERTSYDDSGMVNLHRKLECNNVEIYSESGRDEDDYFFASKNIILDEKVYILVLAGFVGSRFGQWYENFNAGTDTNHFGFDKAKEFGYSKLKIYLDKIGADKDNLKLVITGHSRGGALTNLLAAQLIDEDMIVSKENLYVYTFATPNPVNTPTYKNEKYKGIFSIINPEDFVVRCMPHEWGYRRYGVTLSVPNKDDVKNFSPFYEKMKIIFKDYNVGNEFCCFTKGQKAVNDLFSLMAKKVSNVEEFYNNKFNLLGKKYSLYEYFQNSLCKVVGEKNGSEENKNGTVLLAKGVLGENILRKISLFFIGYEGLYGITNGKLSNTYFSLAHEITAYSAAMLACDEKDMIVFKYVD